MNTNVPLVPGACIVKSAVNPDTVIEINRIIDTRLSEIANIENVKTHDIARLCAAWSQQADWINEICQNLTGKLLNAIEKSGIQPHDNYHPIGCELFTSSIHQKLPTHAHQDLPYRWNDSKPRYALSSWLSLGDYDRQDGILCFFSPPDLDSSLENKLHPAQDFLNSEFKDYRKTRHWQKNQVLAEVNVGDTVVFTSSTWHAATACTSSKSRQAIVVRWASDSGNENTFSTPPPEVKPNQFSMYNSGQTLSVEIKKTFTNCHENKLQRQIAWVLARQYNDHNTEQQAEALPALERLSTYLRLAEYGARPNTEIWLDVRDNVIPFLRSLRNRSI